MTIPPTGPGVYSLLALVVPLLFTSGDLTQVEEVEVKGRSEGVNFGN